MTECDRIIEGIEKRSVRIGVIGLGYVGLPLAISFARKGFRVIGFEKSAGKTEAIGRSESYICDIKNEELGAVVEAGTLSATVDFSRISECEVIIICVPTPLDKFKKPEMSYIQASCEAVGRHLKRHTFISLESTTYPTTTEDFMKPIIERESGLSEGRDFWLCYSPERVDPGNREYRTENTPKVVGGLGDEAQRIGMALYRAAIQSVYSVSSPRVAEMVKILENTYRLVNISLINELALLAGRMNINIWEVIEAAKSKPYGFQAFYPGPGIGGHCIPLDPFYLEYIAKGFNFDLTMINAAGNINNLMPYRMMNKIAFALNRNRKPLNGSNVLFLGIAYKPDVNDARESPALMVMDLVKKKGGLVSYHDPYIPSALDEHGHEWVGVELSDERIAAADCVVFTTNHACFDVEAIVAAARLVVDTRNAVKTVSMENTKVFKL